MYILRWLKYVFWTSLIFPACFHPSPRLRPDGRAAKGDFYGLKFTTIDGKAFGFNQLKGKNVVILNTASSCGYTDQYADWEKFYQENKEEWVVLGFPCNQFLGQEKGNNKEIATFCQLNYGVSFPMFEKSNVKGKQQNPIYRWLTIDSLNGWNNQSPTWNFCKYVVDKNGQLLAFYPSKTKPGDLDFLNLKQRMK